MTLVTFSVPIATPSTANLREHWAAKARRVKAQRQAVSLCWPKGVECSAPATVLLVRVSPRALDDDNLRSALKAVRDEVAKRLGVDDRDPRVTWEYDQQKGRAAVQVAVEASEPA